MRRYGSVWMTERERGVDDEILLWQCMNDERTDRERENYDKI